MQATAKQLAEGGSDTVLDVKYLKESDVPTVGKIKLRKLQEAIAQVARKHNIISQRCAHHGHDSGVNPPHAVAT